MSQYRELGEDSGKMAISYASGLPADHTPALPSFREVSQHTAPGKPTGGFAVRGPARLMYFLIATPASSP